MRPADVLLVLLSDSEAPPSRKASAWLETLFCENIRVRRPIVVGFFADGGTSSPFVLCVKVAEPSGMVGVGSGNFASCD